MKKKPAKSTPVVAAPAPQKYYWAVMKMNSWDSLTVMGLPVGTLKEGPHRFIPVFETREQAVAWDNGSDKYVAMLTTHV